MEVAISVEGSGGRGSVDVSLVLDSLVLDSLVSGMRSEGVDSVEASGDMGSAVVSVFFSGVISWVVCVQGKGMGSVFWRTA